MTRSLGDVIREYRATHGMSMDVFAKRAGLSKAYISMLEKNRDPRTGKNIEPSLETYIAVARATGENVEHVLKESGSDAMVRLGQSMDKIDRAINTHPDLHPIRRIRKIPILGTIACGSPIWADENIEDYIALDPKYMDGEFALYCKGDSMIDAGIYDGDLVLLKKTPIVENGAIAAVLIDDSATLKKVYKQKDFVVLQPCNSAYEPIVTREEMLILGEYVGVYHAK